MPEHEFLIGKLQCRFGIARHILIGVAWSESGFFVTLACFYIDFDWG